MNQGTKQRIVGTVVLLALAAIFLPIIFDGEGSYQPDMSSRIPAAPLVTILPEPTPVRPVIVAEQEQAQRLSASVAEEATQEDTSSSSEPVSEVVSVPIIDASEADEPGVDVTTSEAVFTREAPAFDESGLPQGWSVRLGSFSNAVNANNLIESLLAAEYKAYIRNESSNSRDLSVVYVGPWVDRDRADEYLEQLREQFQLAGIVVAYKLDQL